jgi:hypothetical protein
VRYDSIDKKFLDEARTFGTPGIYPEWSRPCPAYEPGFFM